MTVIHPKR